MKLPGLKGCREQRGMNQRDLALTAGVTQQSVSKFERGTKGSSEPTARRLAEALGVELAELRRAPEAGKSEPRVSRLSLHRAYLKRILAGEVGLRGDAGRRAVGGFLGRGCWGSSPRGGGRWRCWRRS
ncbi:MAG TPA: helix-turn-helix transcriptional regulator [Rubrobacter sp.]|nr:helix-turn-helix transcriptional regulator [Rubrobacter sp.]